MEEKEELVNWINWILRCWLLHRLISYREEEDKNEEGWRGEGQEEEEEAADEEEEEELIARFLNIHRSGVLTALAWLVPCETAAVSAQVLCTPFNNAPVYSVTSFKAT